MIKLADLGACPGSDGKPPFTNFGMNAVEKLFSDDEVEEILELTKRLIT